MIWKQRERSESFRLFKENGYGDLTAVTLSNAGVDNLKDAWDFLHGDELHSPSKIRNIEKATQLIWKHIEEKNRICVFGDFDADGITSSAIMFLALKKLGASVAVRLPDRIGEGYGINIVAIKEQLELGTKLFITVDNGVRAVEEIKYIKECGCDVVVLDHHEPGEVLPEPDALIDLHIPGETYPFVELTGSGLSWKVAHYMLEQVHEHEFAMSLVDLAAIGTVGDVAPLIGENRVMVKRAIKRMRSCRYNRPGVVALLKDISSVTAETIAFQLAPCLNASGRLNERGAELPLILLLETDPQVARMLAEKLSGENERRKGIQAECYKSAREAAGAQISKGNKVIVLCQKEAQSGIAGLLAGNLKEEFNRPSIVFCPKKDLEGNTVWTGSARSIEGFHILDAITACEEHLITYGGHALAAGLTIEASEEKLLEFEKAINEYAQILDEEALVPKSWWDVELSSDELCEDLYAEMDALEPFGAFVPKPIVRLAVDLDERNSHKILGNGKEHIKLFAPQFSLIGFSLADKYIKAQLPQHITAYGCLSRNYFRGEAHNEIMMQDFEN